MAISARWDAGALWSEGPGNQSHAGFSRSFGWSGVEEPAQLATLGYEAGSRARPEVQAHASSSLAGKGASPRSSG